MMKDKNRRLFAEKESKNFDWVRTTRSYPDD